MIDLGTTAMKRALRRFLPSVMNRPGVPGHESTAEMIAFDGPYPSWAAASRAADGYAAPTIFDRVAQSALAVRDGRAIAERDGVTFSEPQVPSRLLLELQAAQAKTDRGLRILDFGGSLGSTYFQCRPHLEPRRGMRWMVVEQEWFVEFGCGELSDEVLSFSSSLPAALAGDRFDAVLCSGVLQYIADPLALLIALRAAGIRTLWIDRTSVIDAADDIFAVQHVPSWAYGVPVSYPVRLFSRSRLLAEVSALWGNPIVGKGSFDGAMHMGQVDIEFVFIAAARSEASA